MAARQFSFTSFQANNPTAPPPGDRLDGEFDRLARTLAAQAPPPPVKIGKNQLEPGLFDQIGASVSARVEALAASAQALLGQVQAAALGALAAAGIARAQNALAQDAAQRSTSEAQAAAASSLAAAASADHADALYIATGNAARDTAGDVATCQAYADVTYAWAEHMPDPIPPNILAVMGITGDHWSSRWWANQAALTVAAGKPGSWTVGSVPFADSTSSLGQDPANLFWDDANNRLGVGTAGPSDRLTVNGALRLTGLGAGTSVAGNGVIDFNPAGSQMRFLSWGPNTLTAGGFVWYGLSSDGSVLTTYMAVVQPGFVGIGTAAAGGNGWTNGKLSVDGNIVLKGAAGGGSWANQRLMWGGDGTGYALNMASQDNGGTIHAPVMTLLDSGNVGINKVDPTAKLQIVGTSAAGAVAAKIGSGPNGADSTTFVMQFLDFAAGVQIGAIARTGTNNVVYATTSDERLKSDVRRSDRGLDALMRIKVSDYRMGGTQSQGLLAQDVHQVYPEAVREGGEDPNLEPWLIDYGRLTPLLIRTAQQQQEYIAMLERRVAALESSRA